MGVQGQPGLPWETLSQTTTAATTINKAKQGVLILDGVWVVQHDGKFVMSSGFVTDQNTNLWDHLTGKTITLEGEYIDIFIEIVKAKIQVRRVIPTTHTLFTLWPAEVPLWGQVVGIWMHSSL